MTFPFPWTLRTIASLVVYPLLHVPLLLLNVWPILAGVYFGWGASAVGFWFLWCIPWGFAVYRMDDWPWWVRLRQRVLAWPDNGPPPLPFQLTGAGRTPFGKATAIIGQVVGTVVVVCFGLWLVGLFLWTAGTLIWHVGRSLLGLG